MLHYSYINNKMLEAGENPALCRNGKVLSMRQTYGFSHRAGKMEYILPKLLFSLKEQGTSPIQQ